MPRPHGTRLRVPAALAAAAATLCAFLGWTTPSCAPGSTRPRPTSDDLVNPDRFARILADDDRLFGQHKPGWDYRAEAARLTPVLIAAMQTATPAEIAGLHKRI